MIKLFKVVILGVFMSAISSQLGAQPRVEDFNFNPLQVKRDPFSPPDIKEAFDVNELQKYDLFEIKLVAVMTGLGSPKAMFVLPNNRTHIVQEGDRIGRNQGRITKIRTNEVIVLESFKDFRGREKKNYETLTLAK